MAACVATVISPVSGHGSPENFHGNAKMVSNNLEPFSLPVVQNGLEEEVLNAYMMAAVEEAAGQVPTEPRQQEVSAERIQKGLHDKQEIIAHSDVESPHPPQVSIADDSIERNCVNDISIELDDTVSGQQRENFLEIPEMKSDQTPEDAKDVKEVAAAVPNEHAVTIESEGAEVRVASNDLPFTTSIPANVIQSNHERQCHAVTQDSEDAVSEDSNATEVEAVVVNESYEIQFGSIVVNDLKAELESTDESDSRTEFADKSSNASVHAAGNAGNVQADEIDKVSSTQATHIYRATKIFPTFSFTGLNHVAFCVENLERSLDFYCGLLGLETNLDRPELPYRGAWLLLGAEGIHIMEVPNPDPVYGRPNHGGYDRHACLNCRNVEGVRLALEKAGIPYQPSIVPSVFARDPDGNGLEFIEIGK